MKAKARTGRKKAARPKDLPASSGAGRSITGGTIKAGTVATNDLGPDNVQKKHVAG
jgi:hypothetical protein